MTMFFAYSLYTKNEFKGKKVKLVLNAVINDKGDYQGDWVVWDKSKWGGSDEWMMIKEKSLTSVQSLMTPAENEILLFFGDRPATYTQQIPPHARYVVFTSRSSWLKKATNLFAVCLYMPIWTLEELKIGSHALIQGREASCAKAETEKQIAESMHFLEEILCIQ